MSDKKKNGRAEATRAALLKAGRQLFGTRGYADTSLDDVAQSAGLTKGAVYHHFSNKGDLFRAVYELVKQELGGKVFPARTVSAEEIWQELLERCRAFVDAHTDSAVQRIVLLDARAVLSWEQWHEIENKYGVVMLRGVLRRAMHRGVIDEQPLHPLAMVLSGAVTAACMLVANAEDPPAARAEAMAVIERLLAGLQRRPVPRPSGDPDESG
jgi:AcrR family transcriptional regulator